MANITKLEVQNVRKKRHSEAYLKMEGPLHDCVLMARITANLMNDVDNGENDKLVFAVYHLEMIERLQEWLPAREDG
ncbi:hypothetical protein [Bradyrhizobium sp. 76]|jgi:hypothetical protein|uniref:hypothetical protein n=1 Tax=Bradyrhizobium sp. 76 TaxID=2782680 RepID=UPI001FFA1F2E|nr:hypothetical protein [Bradyrhizobium sp. 76]MCK1406801.1 hypothetical protein [Bradyrhizobium sp. 76]